MRKYWKRRTTFAYSFSFFLAYTQWEQRRELEVYKRAHRHYTAKNKRAVASIQDGAVIWALILCKNALIVSLVLTRISIHALTPSLILVNIFTKCVGFDSFSFEFPMCGGGPTSFSDRGG